MSAALPASHRPVAERDDAVDIERMIETHGCSREYYAVEECMGEHNRVWSKCQKEVTALKKCNQLKAQIEARKAAAAAGTAAAGAQKAE